MPIFRSSHSQMFFKLRVLKNFATLRGEHFFFFFYQGFHSRTLTTHRTVREERGPFSIPFYHFHPRTNIRTFMCNFAREMTIHQTACYSMRCTTYRITVWLIDDMILIIGLNYGFFTAFWHERNCCTRIRNDHQPCITSDLTNQLC